MRIHYNNGKNEKIIDNVIAINVFGNGYPINVVMKNGSEYEMNLDNIEMILDESVFKKELKENKDE